MWQRYVRGWHLVLLLILVGLIGVAVAYWLTRGSTLDTAGMAAALPAREAALAYVDVGAIRSSGLLEKLVGSSVAEEPEYKAFIQGTGFDYKRDLDAAMLSSAEGTHYFVLQGRFDWAKLRGYAAAQGGRCEGDYCSLAGSTAGRVISFYPIEKNVMALASAGSADAARAIARRTPEKLPFAVPEKPVWVHVPRSALQAQKAQAPPGTRLFLTAVDVAEQMMLTIGPGGEAFEIVMDVSCRSEEEAAVLKAQLEGVTTLLNSMLARQRQTASTADLSGILTSGKFERDSRRVVGRWPLRKAFLESIGGG